MRHKQVIVLLLTTCLLHENAARKLPPSQKLHKARSVNDIDSQCQCPSVEIPEPKCPEAVCPALECPVLECAQCPSCVDQPSELNEDNQESKCPSVCDQPKVVKPDGTSAFTVELSQDRSLSDAVSITFDRVLSDPTDSFTPLLGTFTCPDDDTYAFYWTIQAVEGRVAAMLVKDGEDVKYGPLTSEIPGETGGSSSMAAILRCTEGSHVWLRAVSWPDNTACNRILKDYSSFSAFKLFREGEESASGFTVQMSANTTSSGDLKFDEELVDLGNNYDPSTGYFTVPETGIYVFAVSSHLTSDCDGTYLYNSRGGGGRILFVCNTYASSHDSGTSTVTKIFDCQKDDIIRVNRNTPLTYLGGVTSFTGYRLLNPEDPQDLIAFHASLSADRTVVDGVTIEFDDVSVNIGDYYFPAYGIFICPDDRLYFFTWSIALQNENGNRAGEAKLMMSDELKKTGPQTSRVLTGLESSSSSTQAIVQCEYQKALSIRAVVSDSESVTINYRNSNFMGFRLPSI